MEKTYLSMQENTREFHEHNKMLQNNFLVWGNLYKFNIIYSLVI